MNGYVLAGYGITLGALAGYAAWVLQRGRAFGRQRRGTSR